MRTTKHTNARMTSPTNGKTYVVRSVCNGRVIPGYRAVDALTLPFTARPSVVAKIQARTGLTASEVRARFV